MRKTIKTFTVCIFLLSAVLLSAMYIGTQPDAAQGAAGEKLSAKWLNTTSVNTNVNEASGDFSIVVMGDQQIALHSDKKYMSESYNYIAANKEAMNLKMYINLGDIFDVVDFCDFIGGYDDGTGNGRGRGEDPEAKYWWQQREIVSAEVAKLEAAGVPVALVMGNHDYEDLGFNYRINKTFDQAFPLSRFSGQDYFGGAQYEDIEQAYYYFDAPDGTEYMVLVLGIYPSDEMIEWANDIVAAHPEKKVIVATHAYMTGARDLNPYGHYLWENFISLHENIFMTLCGHSTYDGSIIKKVDFGVNGNAVHQFMIDSQQQEFGGAGVFAQMIFRADGNVDVAYYAPAVQTYAQELSVTANQGMYYTESSQFSFYTGLQRLAVDSAGETFVGNIAGGQSLYQDFAAYSSKNSRWLQDVYAYKNVKILDANGITTDGEGYVTYKLNAGEGYRFKEMTAYTLGSIVKGESGGLSAYQVDISFDGISYVTALYHNSQTGTLALNYKIDRYVLGAQDLYIRILFSGGENIILSSISLTGAVVKTVFEGDNLNVNYDFTKSSVNANNWKTGVYRSLDALIYNDGQEQILGTGDASDHISGKAYLLFRFDSGDNRTFKNFTLNVTMRIREVARTYYFEESIHAPAAEFGFKEQDSYLALRILLSLDNGKTFQEIDTYNNANHIGENVSIAQNLSYYVNGEQSFIIKLQYLGATWDDVGIKTVGFTGNYNANTGSSSPSYVLSGGTVYGDIASPLKDGYVFGGWYLDAQFAGEAVDIEDYKEQAVTLYAKWLRVIRVTYILDGGTNAVENVVVLTEGDTLTLTAPEKQGAVFKGWYDADKVKYTTITAATGHIVLYGVWR